MVALMASAGMYAAIVDGTCGENLQWSLNTKDSTLTITGSGPMKDYSNWDTDNRTPWNEYKAYISNVVFPTGITYIGEASFYEHRNLKSVILPDSVTRVGNYSFAHCTGMESLVLSKNIDTIGVAAFFSCYGIPSLELPEGLKIIQYDAFYHWDGITSVVIPDSVTEIQSTVFQNCANLKEVILGTGISKIGENAFQNTPIIRLTVAAVNPPSGGAACGLDATKCKLYVPAESVETYKNAVWWEDFKEILAIGTAETVYDIQVQVTFPQGAPEAGIEVYGAFNDSIPVAMNYHTSGVWWADIKATELQTLSFRETGNPDNYVEYQTLVGWIPVPEILIGEMMEESEGKYFVVLDFTKVDSRWKINYSCGDNLKWNVKEGVLTITGTGAMWEYDVVDAPWGTDITAVVLPEGLTSIGAYAFWNCAELGSVSIPQKVAKIGVGAFEGCAKLDSVTWNAADCPVTVVEENIYPPFYAIREQITSFTLGESVVKVPMYLCANMTQLKSLTIPANVKEIGVNAFGGCSNVTSIVWNAIECPTKEEGESVYPPFYAIRQQINSFTIGESAKKLPSYLCYEMGALKEISIPAGVTAIGVAAFASLPKAVVTALGETPAAMGDYAFEGVKTIYVPCGTIESYQKSWKAYASAIQYPKLAYTITGKVNIAEAGKVIVPTTICDKEEIEAIANEGYQFVKWSDGSLENPRAIEITEDATYTAEFESTEGVEDVQGDNVQCTKLLRNGQIYILRGEKVFTLTGQAVK